MLLMLMVLPPLAADGPPSPKAVVARFAEEFCRPESNQLAAAKRWKLPGWQVVRSEVERGITYAVDGPIAENDVYDDRIGGPVRGGEGFLSATTIDYRSESVDDYSFALLTIEPDTLLDQRTIERLLRTELIANGEALQHERGSRWYRNGEPPRKPVPIDSWTQRYRARETFGKRVEIKASRTWGDGGPERKWVIQCSNHRRVVLPGE